jgi:chromosome segregation ATPase
LESLKLRNQHLAEVLVDREEELVTTKNEAKETKTRLHNIIDDLENKIEICQNEKQVKVSELEGMLDYKDREIKHLEDKTNELENAMEVKNEEIDLLEQQFKQHEAKQERQKIKKVKKESQKAKKAEKNLQESNSNLSEVENNNTFKDENLVDEEPTCDVCKGLSEEHADNCDNLKIKLKDYIPVKMRSYPIMPFIYQVNQEAVEKYMEIFGNHRCMECKELKFELGGWVAIPYWNNYIQFTLLNADFN